MVLGQWLLALILGAIFLPKTDRDRRDDERESRNSSNLARGRNATALDRNIPQRK